MEAPQSFLVQESKANLGKSSKFNLGSTQYTGLALLFGSQIELRLSYLRCCVTSTTTLPGETYYYQKERMVIG
jgi:hypothetical protein